MAALNYLMRKGVSEKKLTLDYFDKVFSIFKEYIKRRRITLTSLDFPSGGQQNQRKFANLIVSAIDEFDSIDLLDNKNFIFK